MSSTTASISDADLARILEASRLRQRRIGHPILEPQHWAAIEALAADEQARRAGGGS